MRWDGWFPREGVSAHPKVDPATGELLFFNYATTEPYLHYGVVDAANDVAHYTPIDLPGPRLPHDMAFTENFAILNDCPLFWDADLLARGVHAVRFHPDLPTRIGVLPRRGTNDDIRWFEAVADLRAALDQRLRGRRRGRRRRLLRAQPRSDDRAGRAGDRSPGRDDAERRMFRFLDATALDPVPYRWRLDLRTGAVKEEIAVRRRERVRHDQRWPPRPALPLLLLARSAARMVPVRRAPAHRRRRPERPTSTSPTTVCSSARRRWRRGPAARAEDDGYVVTFTTDINDDRSECLVFDAADLAAGPLARVQLPERICTGTHSSLDADRPP